MSFFGELRRRNVDRVGIAYLAAVWVLIEVADTLVSIVNAPAWIPQVLVYSAALGFPLALVLAWFYEWTSQGIRVTGDVAAIEAVKFTGRKLDFAIIGLLVVAIGFLLVGRGEAPAPSIAALPFSNESAEEENAEFFANGIHDELLTQLGKISSLKVISRNSVEEYRDSPKNSREIGRELGVATLLLGRVQRAGDMVRISAELIDAESDRQIWRESYDREVTAENLFALQREMATAISGALQATLSPEEVTRLNEVPTTNTRAYEFYLSGNEYFIRDQNEKADFPLAVRQYRRALDEDPEFSLAWIGLARAHAIMYFAEVDRTESRRELALEAIERAFQLSPDLSEAHLAMGYYHYHVLDDYANALEEWDIAEQGMTGDSELYAARGYVYRRMGEWKLAAENLDRAVELDPRRLDLLITQEITYENLRDYTRAEQILDRMLELAPDSGFVPLRRPRLPLLRNGDSSSIRAAREDGSIRMEGGSALFLWRAALYEGDYEMALELLGEWDIEVNDWEREYRPIATYYAVTYELAGMLDLAAPQLQAARTRIERERELSPEDPRLLIALGEVLAELGEGESATELALQAMELPPASNDAVSRPTFHLNAIMVFVAAGDHDSAIEELDAYLSVPGGFWSIEGLLPDPRLDPIRDDPRFLDLVEKYKR